MSSDISVIASIFMTYLITVGIIMWIINVYLPVNAKIKMVIYIMVISIAVIRFLRAFFLE
jgi:hypothetical protein